jgi:hypothetical protein
MTRCEDAKDCVQLLYSMSVAQVGLDTSFEEEQLNTGDETGFIPRIRMRRAWVIETWP